MGESVSKFKKILERIWTLLPDFVKRPKTLFMFYKSFRRLSRIELDNINTWYKRDFTSPSPGLVKFQVLKKWGGRETWVESGTYLGDTTHLLAQFVRSIITIEPQETYAKNAQRRFSSMKNVKVLHGLSENLIDNLLMSLDKEDKADVSFWLDGHFSDDETFKGPLDTPIVAELKAISNNLNNIVTITVLIDDVRCFYGNNSEYKDYPTIKYLSEWANSHDLFWTIEHDIFIATNRER